MTPSAMFVFPDSDRIDDPSQQAGIIMLGDVREDDVGDDGTLGLENRAATYLAEKFQRALIRETLIGDSTTSHQLPPAAHEMIPAKFSS